MSAEELDKLFKDKLANHPVTPRPDAWARLQAQMQPEEEKKERKPFMWIYATAASVAVLLTAGILTLKDGEFNAQADAPLAAVESTSPTRKPVQEETSSIEELAKAQESAIASVEDAPEKNQTIQATQLASTASYSQREQRTKAEREQKMSTQRDQESSFTKTRETPVVLASATSAKAAPVMEEAPMEIIVKLDSREEQTALAQVTPDEEQPQEKSKAGKLVKGLFKQVKNIKQGEGVNLSDLGYTKHTYALETRIGNKKISKTINL